MYIAVKTFNDKTLLKKAYNAIEKETKVLKKITEVREVEKKAIKLIEDIKNGIILKNLSTNILELACAVFGKEHVNDISKEMKKNKRASTFQAVVERSETLTPAAISRTLVR